MTCIITQCLLRVHKENYIVLVRQIRVVNRFEKHIHQNTRLLLLPILDNVTTIESPNLLATSRDITLQRL